MKFTEFPRRHTIVNTGGRPVELLWASPDCTFHSKARGGKPFRDPKSAKGRRGLAWVVVRWAKEVRPRLICLENVEELENWGPLGDDGRPDPERRGSTFKRWVGMLRAQGYAVEWRQLRACDYGAPTTRRRLFVIARCDGEPIVWPEATHGPGQIPFRTAAECIDWTIPCPSIFGRSKPLAENTLKRIGRGLQRFVIDAEEPFIAPYLVKYYGTATGQAIHEPIDTITTRDRLALVSPTLVKNMTNNVGQRVDLPLSTILTGNHHYMVSPTLIHCGNGERVGQAPRVYDIHAPLGTIMATGQKHALVTAVLARHYSGHGNDGVPLTRPISTTTTKDHHALLTAALEPLEADRSDQVHAFMTRYAAGETTVTVDGIAYQIADIGMRMLQPRELLAAQGFDQHYKIDAEVDGKPLSKTAQIRMVGNSVSPPIAAAILRANARDEMRKAA